MMDWFIFFLFQVWKSGVIEFADIDFTWPRLDQNFVLKIHSRRDLQIQSVNILVIINRLAISHAKHLAIPVGVDGLTFREILISLILVDHPNLREQTLSKSLE